MKRKSKIGGVAGRTSSARSGRQTSPALIYLRSNKQGFVWKQVCSRCTRHGLISIPSELCALKGGFCHNGRKALTTGSRKK
jgi:hypothetical protein